VNDIPSAVRITEEGPREGFQIEKGPIATARKIALIDALSQTGLDHIQIVSFVNPKAVPGMADADDVVRGIAPRNGVAYTALWLNKKGFERALQFSDRLANTGTEPQRGTAACRAARHRRELQDRRRCGGARRHHGGVRL
jgi:hydroxymethylglutaryl-CoA lyase